MNSDTKKRLVDMVSTGDYFLWLTEWKPRDGQYLLMYTSDQGVAKGLPRRLVESRMVRPGGPPKWAKFNKSGGVMYKSGRFTIQNSSISKLLKINKVNN
jgi:hypothetical protein